MKGGGDDNVVLAGDACHRESLAGLRRVLAVRSLRARIARTGSK
jgi:hypothetical protein